MDPESAAEEWFLDIAAACGLSHDLKEIVGEPPVFVLPVQDGLTVECFLEFDGFDEIHFGVGSVFFMSDFPFPKVTADFRRRVVGFLSGQNRIRSRFGSAVLESPYKDGWRIEARYSGLTWNGWRERVIHAQQ